MRRKSKLSRARHEELGKELAGIRDRLGAISVELGHGYQLSVASAATKAQTAIDHLCSKLDDVVFHEYPSETDASNKRV